MTAFCMIVGEKFGRYKYTPDKISDFSRMMANSCQKASNAFDDTKLKGALNEIPDLMRQVFLTEVSMMEVSEWPSIQDWSFFASGSEAPESKNLLGTTDI